MDKTQKIIFGVAVVSLVVAVVFFLYGKKRDNHEQLQQLPEQAVQRVQELSRPQRTQHHQQLPQQHQQLPQQHQQLPQQQSNKVLVMFFAPWCGHCKTLEPTWEELSQNFDGYNGVKIVKVNGQENPEACQVHGVNGFPTVKMCHNGLDSPDGVVYQGDRSINSLAQFLQENA